MSARRRMKLASACASLSSGLSLRWEESGEAGGGSAAAEPCSDCAGGPISSSACRQPMSLHPGARQSFAACGVDSRDKRAVFVLNLRAELNERPQ
jgi:hypothetical protein